MLMFVHSLTSTPLDFGDQVSAMPDALQGQAPWLRGVRPGSRGERFDVREAAADLGMTVELSGAPRATLVGVGEGALVSLELALARPDLPVDLVVLGPALATSAGAGFQRRLTRLLPRRFFAARGVDKAKAVDALAGLADLDQWSRLSELQCRVLLVVGGRDRAAQAAAQAFEAAATSADVRTVVIPDAGVAPHLEAPAVVNDALYGFVGVEPRRR